MDIPWIKFMIKFMISSIFFGGTIGFSKGGRCVFIYDVSGVNLVVSHMACWKMPMACYFDDFPSCTAPCWDFELPSAIFEGTESEI